MSPEENYPILDEELFKQISEVVGDSLGSMLQVYSETSQGYLDDIISAFHSSDMEAIIRPAHTLKSSSKQIGALRIGYLAECIEKHAREMQENSQSPDFEFLHKHTEHIKKALLETDEAFKARLI